MAPLPSNSLFSEDYAMKELLSRTLTVLTEIGSNETSKAVMNYINCLSPVIPMITKSHDKMIRQTSSWMKWNRFGIQGLNFQLNKLKTDREVALNYDKELNIGWVWFFRTISRNLIFLFRRNDYRAAIYNISEAAEKAVKRIIEEKAGQLFPQKQKVASTTIFIRLDP